MFLQLLCTFETSSWGAIPRDCLSIKVCLQYCEVWSVGRACFTFLHSIQLLLPSTPQCTDDAAANLKSIPDEVFFLVTHKDRKTGGNRLPSHATGTLHLIRSANVTVSSTFLTTIDYLSAIKHEAYFLTSRACRCVFMSVRVKVIRIY